MPEQEKVCRSDASVVAVGCVRGIMLQPRRSASYCAANNEDLIQTGYFDCNIELAVSDSGVPPSGISN